MPSCAEARPRTCPCCAAAAQPMGAAFVIVGHGHVERAVRGPMTAGGTPEVVDIVMRRYRCRACKAILVVGPRGVVARRAYRAGAIAAAIAAYASGETSAAVRARTSPSKQLGVAARERWITLTRWVDDASGGKLFGVRGIGGLTRRGAAEQVALALAGRGGRRIGHDLLEAAFDGAEIAA